MQSIWRKETELPSRPQLREDITADAAVIGAGMAGILTAHFLQEQGLKVVVLEAERTAGGQTENTTAKITAQHGLIYSKLAQKLGWDAAKNYASANQQAVEQYAKLVEEFKISCAFERQPAYLYTLEDAQKLEQETAAAEKLGLPAEFTTDTGLPFDVKGAERFSGQAQFQPLEFIKKLSEPLCIYENTQVTDIQEKTLITPSAKVRAEQIVVATHYPFLNTPGYYFVRMHQQRSYVLALEQAQNVRGMYISADPQGYSFRNYQDLLLLGGGGHRTGENSGGEKYETLRRAAADFFPDCKEIAYWSAQDCMTLDNLPYIGHYSASTPQLYVATGFHKWGMTGSMVAATLLSDLAVGKENPYTELFSPQRFHISASMKNLSTDGLQAVKGLGKELLSLPDKTLEELPLGHGGVVEHKGEKVGVYKTEEGKCYLVSVKCPHLGCQLEWNPDERSWDCPCHGSRFDYHGHLIANPAMEGLPHA